MKVFILTEGGTNIGFGHITRSLSIYQAFEKKDISPTLLIHGDNTIDDLIKDKKHVIFNWMKEKKKLIEIIKDADMVILDSYLADVNFYEEISRSVKIPVYIDDNNRISYPRGIVVNGTRYAKKLDYPKKTDVTYFLGIKYTLFREEFWRVPDKHLRRNISSILLFFGASDSKNLTTKILKFLNKEYPRLTKNIVITMGFKNLDELNKIIDENTSIIFNPDAEKIKEIMLLSDIALTSGGQTLYELCRVGLTAIVIAVADNQMNSIKDLKESGLIYYAGKWNDSDLMSKIKKYIEKLDSYDIRLKKSLKMRKVFDGKSTSYLIEQLINRYERNVNEK